LTYIFWTFLFHPVFPFLEFFAEAAQKGAQGNPGTLPEYHLRAEITIEFRTNANAFARAAGKMSGYRAGIMYQRFLGNLGYTEKQS
jgi:hypothetical protein